MKMGSAVISKEQEYHDLVSTHLLDLQRDTTIDEPVKILEEDVVTTRELYKNGLYERVHQAVLAIDSELNSAVDEQFRRLLVKTAYSLRSLEESIIKPPPKGDNSGMN